MAKREKKRRGRQMLSGKAIGEAVGGTLGGAIDLAVGSAEQVGRFLGSAVGLPGFELHQQAKHRTPPGSAAGIEYAPDSNTPPPPGTITIRGIDYGPDHYELFTCDELESLFNRPRGDNVKVRWINVDGLHPYVLRQFCERMGYHSLAAEDVLQVPQRPKVEVFERELFVIARMLRLDGRALLPEQVSFFLNDHTLVTFQETVGDVFDPIRKRIEDAGSRLRRSDASFLLYALIDAIVDHGFPILERYGDMLELLENEIVERPTTDAQRNVHVIKRELSMLRRAIWPTREVVSTLVNDQTPFIASDTRTYLRDVYEHTVQLVEVVETFREMASGLTDLYMSAVGNRMNEIMKVLTIMASLFIPITFIAGVYGMNFAYIPETQWEYSYYAFWVVCIVVTLGLLGFFWKRGWIGR